MTVGSAPHRISNECLSSLYMIAVTSEALENSPDNPGTNASCTDETNNGPIQIMNGR